MVIDAGGHFRLAQVTPLPGGFRAAVLPEHPAIETADFADAMRVLFAALPPVHDRWTAALAELGHETLEIMLDVPGLRQRWAREKGRPEPVDEIDFAIAQLQDFRPDVLLLRDHLVFSSSDIDRMRQQCPSIRLVVAWVGAPPLMVDSLTRVDLVFSCMQNYVDEFRHQGQTAQLIHHAFAPQWRQATDHGAERDIPLSFIGSVYGMRGLHETRQQVLEAIVANLPIAVFGQLGNHGLAYLLKSAAKRVLWPIRSGLEKAGVSPDVLSRVPLLRSVAGPSRIMPASRRLRAATRSPVWGAQMYRTLARSRITWNCHIDATGPYAANVRLFEATGMGCCLVTDRKANLPGLFEPERDVVTYANAAECIDKLRWLLDNPAKAEDIGQAGLRRCLAQHTFSHRAPVIEGAIRAAL